MNYLCSEVISGFIFPQLQLSMHQVIYVGQVACNVNLSTQLHPFMDMNTGTHDDSKGGMEDMEIGRVLLFFSFHYCHQEFCCALINWFVHDEEPDPDTGMWTVQLECDSNGQATVDVIYLDTIARGAHLLPVYGSSRVPDDFNYHDALDSFYSFFVNHFIDHHAHKFLTAL